jgi:hypothetical protein
MLHTSYATGPSRVALDGDFGRHSTLDASARTLQLHQLPERTQAAVKDLLVAETHDAEWVALWGSQFKCLSDRSDGADDDTSPESAPAEWSEDDVVQLHWRLLLEVRRLADPDTPLEEKLDTLAWVLTDPALDDQPFSFANCLRVVGNSPLSPTGYFGDLKVEDVREWLRTNATKWLRATLARYPDWVQALIRQQPDWVAKQLSRNPQWINEQIRAREGESQGDLFSSAQPLLAC